MLPHCPNMAPSQRGASRNALVNQRVQQGQAEEVAHLAEPDARRVSVNRHDAVDGHKPEVHGEAEAYEGGGGQARSCHRVDAEARLLLIPMVVLDRELKVHRGRGLLNDDVHKSRMVPDSALVHVRHVRHVYHLHHGWVALSMCRGCRPATGRMKPWSVSFDWCSSGSWL